MGRLPADGAASQAQSMQQDVCAGGQVPSRGMALHAGAAAAASSSLVPVSSPADGSGSQGATSMYANVQQRLTPQQAILIRSLHIRAAFGGMRGT